MKTRNGFVSNSSSSSFTVVVTKEEFDRAFEEAHPYEQAVMKVADRKDTVFLGTPVVAFSTLSTPGGSMWEYVSVAYDGEIPERYDDYPGEAFSMFVRSLDNDKMMSVEVYDG